MWNRDGYITRPVYKNKDRPTVLNCYSGTGMDTSPRPRCCRQQKSWPRNRWAKEFWFHCAIAQLTRWSIVPLNRWPSFQWSFDSLKWSIVPLDHCSIEPMIHCYIDPLNLHFNDLLIHWYNDQLSHWDITAPLDPRSNDLLIHWWIDPLIYCAQTG